MTELSLHILDIAQNSLKAGCTLTEIEIKADTKANSLVIRVSDNGCGMSKEQLARVTDPFFTTRTTRKVGLGISLFKLAAEQTGGSLTIQSTQGIGTTLTAVFVLSSIDRMPLGDIGSTVFTLITCNPDLDFLFTYTVDDRSFTLDTREMRVILQGVPFTAPEVMVYIKETLAENKQETDAGILL